MPEKNLYIYHHSPKCGGQSFRASCRKLGLTLIVESVPKRENPDDWNHFLQNKVDLLAQPDNTMLCGHLIFDGIRPRERYAEEIAAAKIRIVTVLREPLERGISAYFFRQKKGFETFATVEDRLRKMKNAMSSHLGFEGGSAREFLETFFFVGVTEYLGPSTQVLAAMLGKEAVESERINVTPRKPYEISPEGLEIFKENNQLDYALYNTAIEMLNERHLALLGKPLPDPAR